MRITTRKRQLRVADMDLGEEREREAESFAAAARGMTIAGELHLDLTFSWRPGHDIYCRRVNSDIESALNV